MRVRLECPLAVGLALLVSIFAASCDSGDRDPAATRADATVASDERCRVGAARGAPGLPVGERAIVLACGRTRAGNEVELYSFEDAGGPCLNIEGLPGGTRACGRAPSERVPPARAALTGPAIVRRSARAGLELYGETAPDVRLVLVRYRLPHGRQRQNRATVIQVGDRAALRAAGIRRPFGYFIGTVPPRARQVLAVARGRSGEILGRLEFDRLARGMHPTVFIASDAALR
jgi:hypothetical protein